MANPAGGDGVALAARRCIVFIGLRVRQACVWLSSGGSLACNCTCNQLGTQKRAPLRSKKPPTDLLPPTSKPLNASSWLDRKGSRPMLPCDAGLLCCCLTVLCWLAPEALEPGPNDEGVGTGPPGLPCWLLVVVNVAAGGLLPGAGCLVFWAFMELFLPMPDTPDSRPEKLSSFWARPAMVSVSKDDASGNELD